VQAATMNSLATVVVRIVTGFAAIIIMAAVSTGYVLARLPTGWGVVMSAAIILFIVTFFVAFLRR
jgi:hypothetical protein